MHPLSGHSKLFELAKVKETLMGFSDDTNGVLIPLQRKGDCCSEKLETVHSFFLQTIDGESSCLFESRVT